MESKTRNAYLIRDNGDEIFLCDTVSTALRANYTVNEYEKMLINDNAGYKIIVRVESCNGKL